MESMTTEKVNVKWHVSMTPNEQKEKHQQKQPAGYKTLDQEITETLIAKNNDPKEPINYIRSAKLYSCQGHQQEAVNVLREGLTIVTDSEHHLMLQQEMDMIKSRLKRKIDFIAQCPYEIIYNIVGRVASYNKNMILVCSKVSTTWHQKLLNQKQIWRSIELDDGEFGNNIHQILPDISNLIKHLSISITDGSTYKRHMKAFKKYSFNNLKSLKIKADFNLEQEDVQLLSDNLFVILPNVATTLEKLELEMPSCKEISMEWLLMTCSKLTKIRLDVYTLIDDDIDEIQVPDTMSLTVLDLVTIETIPTPVLESLFRHSPHLRSLNIYSMMGHNMLEILDDMCPELTEIRIYDIRPLHHDFSDIPEPTTIKPTKGLRHLKIDNIQSAIPLDFRLAKSSDTLQTLSLVIHPLIGHMTTLDDWRPFSLYTMSQLNTLEISTGPPAFCQLLPTILSCTPALQKLSLFSLLIAHDDQVTRDALFDAIGNLTQLANLEIVNVQINGHGFERMLMKQGAYSATITQEENMKRNNISNSQQPHSTNNTNNSIPNGLQYLCIDYCRGFKGSMLQNIAKIKTLNQISVISTEEDQVNEVDLGDFIHSLYDNLPLVTALHFDNMPFTAEIAKNMTKWDPERFTKIKLGEGMIYNFGTKCAIKEILNDHFSIKFESV
ncbi:hypothetical protein INT45_012272 [Circinella minor]|uniref:F-box domain-containing protein n=1 Tax=Circinella minor TaxID=1195481 RepID=A0A8H7VN61_9FUNG|nr:hypothetical protein INT45_012272 [Circinella minor]